MIVLDSPAAARNWCRTQREAGLSIGMVPTMGALHSGHLKLVQRSVEENDLCVVSIFVNPLQFNERTDFDAYPRDIETDSLMLEAAGCDMVFTGTLMQFFPEQQYPEDIPLLDPGPFAVGLEGAQRPGHFAGVRTIVDRLFGTVQPDRAYFGEKDFQQTLVVKDLASTLGFPQIVVCNTEREPDGLAMSSRNQRLSEAEREEAGVIFRALCAARDAWREGERDRYRLTAIMHKVLSESTLVVEYLEVRDPEHWSIVDSGPLPDRGRALVAARCGSVRLIDNMDLAS
jgi:pantoate--beta-alanine ligase